MGNRYICGVFEEMRKCLETNNFSYLGGLIEEAQVMANRMEAKLYDQKDYKRAMARLKKVKAKIKALEERANIADED